MNASERATLRFWLHSSSCFNINSLIPLLQFFIDSRLDNQMFRVHRVHTINKLSYLLLTFAAFCWYLIIEINFKIRISIILYLKRMFWKQKYLVFKNRNFKQNTLISGFKEKAHNFEYIKQFLKAGLRSRTTLLVDSFIHSFK